jgi:hypothetical protein
MCSSPTKKKKMAVLQARTQNLLACANPQPRVPRSPALNVRLQRMLRPAHSAHAWAEPDSGRQGVRR